MSHPVLIDTDTGVDDAMALILAFHCPELSIEAITTVAGNVETPKCTRNVLKVLDLIHPIRRPRVGHGAERPLARALTTAPEVHGADGLGGAAGDGRIPAVPDGVSPAVDVIADACNRFGSRLTIVALGPLTNLALANRLHPRSFRRLGRIISMGGAFHVPGNTGPLAEFNYYVDPEAAQEILNAAVPVTVIPLDVTEQCILTRRQLEALVERRPGRLGRFVLRMTEYYMRYHEVTEGFFGGYLHDPLAVAVAANSTLVRTAAASVHVQCAGTWTRGMTVRSKSPGSPVRVATSVDRTRVLRLIRNRLLG